MTLAGTNTYGGVTTISGGTLQIGSGGTLGTLGINTVTDNATLAFNRSDAIDDSGFGLISGTGSLAKRGTGRLALTKAQTYSGATTVEAGTLALTNSGAIANSTNITVLAGALFDVSGTTGGTMTLGIGKTIAGNGSVKGNFNLDPRAKLSPGTNGIGTLTFSNSLTLFSGPGAPPCTNLFEISKSPTTNDVVRVFGALTNGGTLIVTNISANALAAGDTFKLFNAASYASSFSSLILPPLNSGLLWDTNTVNTNGTVKVIAIAPPMFSSVTQLGNGTLRLNFSGTPGANYEIRASTNLTLTPVTLWNLLGTGTFSAAPVVFDDVLARNFPQRFYRIRVP